jgi:hypothetical protein
MCLLFIVSGLSMLEWAQFLFPLHFGLSELSEVPKELH